MHAAPDKRAPPGNRLARGSPGGVWARDIPCIDGLSLVTGMVAPQAALLLKPAARSSVVGWMLGVWEVGFEPSAGLLRRSRSERWTPCDL